MKNLEINELNEKVKNELKKEDQNELKNTSWFSTLIKRYHKWNFELTKKIYKLKKDMKRKQTDVKNITVFSGLIIVVLYGFYACLVNDVHLAEKLFHLFGF